MQIIKDIELLGSLELNSHLKFSETIIFSETGINEGKLSSLRQFQGTESSLKNRERCFLFHLKHSFPS